MTEANTKEKLLTEAEVNERYPNEWVTVEVVTTDRNGYWKKGRVITHGPTREDSLKRVRYWRAKHPDAHTAHIFTGPLMAEDVAVWIDLWPLFSEDSQVEDGEAG